MEVHAEYFLKCTEAVQWLNTPQPVTGVAKEFLDGAHAVTAINAGLCHRSSEELPLSKATCEPPQHLSKETIVAKLSTASSSSSLRSPRRPKKPATCCSSATSPDLDVAALDTGFPSLEDLARGATFENKSLLYVPVELHDHFVFGVVVGTPVPPPDGVDADDWVPLVTRFVLDAGRKCCLLFSYFAEGSIVVLMDCFDEVGDHFQEITFFDPTPVAGVFPRGIRGRMQIFEKRDCPKCTTACVSCSCPVNERVEAIVKQRQNRVTVPGHGPAHAGSTYKDENVVIQTYPYWAQILDEYKWSRVGSYCVQIRYTSTRRGVTHSKAPTAPRTLAYRVSVHAEQRTTVDKMLRVALFDKGVSALKPPATDVRWETSSTISVNAKNEVKSHTDPCMSVCFTDWHKLPGFQEDYLLVAPSNIVSGAHARAELARAEAERLAARARSGVPVLPSWASGRAGVFEHILTESGPELQAFCDDLQTTRDNFRTSSADFQAQMIRSIPQASVAAVMRPRGSIEKQRQRSRDRSPRVSLEEQNGMSKLRSFTDSNKRRRRPPPPQGFEQRP